MQRKFFEELMNWKEQNVETPLMVVGARQIGKTYIIDKFCKENYKDYIYINLMDNKDIIEIFQENINTVEKIKKMELYLNHLITKETIIFFDEIQESEKLISSLKYFCEAEFPYKIICAGSLLGVKLKRFQSSFPVGKVIIKYMYPMTFDEFLNAIGYQQIIPEIKKCYEQNIKMSKPIHEKLLEYYRLFLCTGGMPVAVKEIIKNDLQILKFDHSILASIIDAYQADMKKYT
ncbi:MAG: AAA family ATPase, partial [Erysipelotrichaceae bacterium]|nr:AAA family ATPase [Erysipelotrichaceae bacterium]